MSLPPDNWNEDTLEDPTVEGQKLPEWENPEWSGPSALIITLQRVLLTPKTFFANLPRPAA